MPIRDPDDRFAQSDCASVGDPFTSRRPVAIASLPALRSARDPVGDERMTAVMSLYHRWRMLVHELTKFGIVGAFNTGLDFGVANLLHVGLHTNQYLAKTVSVTIALTCIWLVMGPLGRSGVLWFNVAQVAGLVLGMLFRFTTYKRWVFVAPPEHGSPGEMTGERQPVWSRTRI